MHNNLKHLIRYAKKKTVGFHFYVKPVCAHLCVIRFIGGHRQTIKVSYTCVYLESRDILHRSLVSINGITLWIAKNAAFYFIRKKISMSLFLRYDY